MRGELKCGHVFRGLGLACVWVLSGCDETPDGNGDMDELQYCVESDYALPTDWTGPETGAVVATLQAKLDAVEGINWEANRVVASGEASGDLGTTFEANVEQSGEAFVRERKSGSSDPQDCPYADVFLVVPISVNATLSDAAGAATAGGTLEVLASSTAPGSIYLLQMYPVPRDRQTSTGSDLPVTWQGEWGDYAVASAQREMTSGFGTPDAEDLTFWLSFYEPLHYDSVAGTITGGIEFLAAKENSGLLTLSHGDFIFGSTAGAGGDSGSAE